MLGFRLFVLLLFAAAELSLAPKTALLRLAVTGDTGKGADTVAAGIARLHAQKPFDAILLTGDNFYPCGIISETDPRWSLVTALTRVGPPVFPVLRVASDELRELPRNFTRTSLFRRRSSSSPS